MSYKTIGQIFKSNAAIDTKLVSHVLTTFYCQRPQHFFSFICQTFVQIISKNYFGMTENHDRLGRPIILFKAIFYVNFNGDVTIAY